MPLSAWLRALNIPSRKLRDSGDKYLDARRGVGGKLATRMIGAAEKAAASSSNVISGIGKNTLGAIREGGATSSVTTGASAVTQKAGDVATGAAGKEIENRTK